LELTQRENGPSRLFVAAAADPGSEWSAGAGVATRRELIDWLSRSAATDEAVLALPDLLDLVLPAVQADRAWLDGYRPSIQHRLSCPITVFVGASDPRADLAAGARWSDWTEGSVSLRELPGGHFFPTEQRGALLECIRSDMANRPHAASAAALPQPQTE